jgi:undecaprenyl diphosphate synthase
MDNKQNVPEHIAVIMDGNRRWAKKRGLSATSGHKEGYENFKKITKACQKMGVKVLTVYAFSVENWKRSKMEVSFLMNLMAESLKKEIGLFKENNIKLNIIGQKEKLPQKTKDAIDRAEEETKNNDDLVLNIAISYGGRQEIIDAVKKIIKEKINPDKVDEKVIADHLYTANQPDPDFVIRTSGEMRLSGFLPWQTVYSELYFSEKLWPDFKEKDLKKAIAEFRRRGRRFGK